MKPATLLHNTEAGFEQYSTESLLSALRDIGYEAEARGSKKEQLEESLKQPSELVVTAGGDGTVGAVARLLIGRNIPIATLPLGTANNIATSLGIAGDPFDIIAGWKGATPSTFDVGVTEGKQGRSYFLESVGFGPFPHLINERRGSRGAKESREAELADALQHELQIIARYKSHICTIELDDTTLTGDYLMVEIMNTPYCGPKLKLAPEADFNDGLLDIVLVHADERREIATVLAHCLADNKSKHCLTTHRSRNIKIIWHGQHHHSDDKTHEGMTPVELNIHVEPKKLLFLPGNKA